MNSAHCRSAGLKTAARGLAVSMLALSCLGLSAGTGAAAPPKEKIQAPSQHAPLSTEASLRMARAFANAGDPGSAVTLYRDLIARNPDQSLLVEYGDVLVDAGLIDDAITIYEKVDPKSPSHVGALLGLATAQLRLSQPGKALAYLDQAVAANPAVEQVQVARGVALDNLGRHADAQESYRAALVQSPRSVAARSDLALSLAMTGQYQQAIDILTPIAKSANATPRLRQNLALIYGLKGDRDAALRMSRADLEPDAALANQQFFDFVHQSPR